MLVNYVHTCNEHGITVIPILFNENNLDPALLRDEAREGCEKYTATIVHAFKDEEGNYKS